MDFRHQHQTSNFGGRSNQRIPDPSLCLRNRDSRCFSI
jgi:hypothetical protein